MASRGPQRSSGDRADRAVSHPSAASGPTTVEQSPDRGREDAASAEIQPDVKLLAALDSFAEMLRRRPLDRRAVAKEIARVKTMVHEAAPEEAALALIAMLETGEDHATDLRFFVGPEGVMEETPTFRTALLDLLGQTDPGLSADYARRVLKETASADEYALGLRNVAWADPGGRFTEELRQGFRAMLARPTWTAAPSTGFLEAFDLAVATGAVEEVATLIPPQAGDAPEHPVTRAAFVALDRLMLSDPASVVAWWQRNPDALSGAPDYRASLLSRLDVRDPAQEQILSSYLLRQDHGPGELAYFTRLFPNGNFFTGYRLVTGAVDGTGNVAARDQATVEILQEWLQRPEFESRRPELAAMVARLQSFAAPAGP